jgi:hypothetical protein
MTTKGRTREEIREERRRLRMEYGELFDSTAALLLRHDPIGINFDDNADEYEPEAGTILPRLRGCRSANDVRRVVHEEFVRCFEAGTAGEEERYSAIGRCGRNPKQVVNSGVAVAFPVPRGYYFSGSPRRRTFQSISS